MTDNIFDELNYGFTGFYGLRKKERMNIIYFFYLFLNKCLQKSSLKKSETENMIIFLNN